jgi:hypothetical protein
LEDIPAGKGQVGGLIIHILELTLFFTAIEKNSRAGFKTCFNFFCKISLINTGP